MRWKPVACGAVAALILAGYGVLHGQPSPTAGPTVTVDEIKHPVRGDADATKYPALKVFIDGTQGPITVTGTEPLAVTPRSARWDYEVHNAGGTNEQLVDLLRQRGAEGYELVQVLPKPDNTFRVIMKKARSE